MRIFVKILLEILGPQILNYYDYLKNNLQITTSMFRTFANYNVSVYFLRFTVTETSKSTPFKPNHIISTILVVAILG